MGNAGGSEKTDMSLGREPDVPRIIITPVRADAAIGIEETLIDHERIVVLAYDLARQRGAGVVLDALADAFQIMAEESRADRDVSARWQEAAEKVMALVCELTPALSWPNGGTTS